MGEGKGSVLGAGRNVGGAGQEGGDVGAEADHIGAAVIRSVMPFRPLGPFRPGAFVAALTLLGLSRRAALFLARST